MKRDRDMSLAMDARMTTINNLRRRSPKLGCFSPIKVRACAMPALLGLYGTGSSSTFEGFHRAPFWAPTEPRKDEWGIE
ncbi:MAG: hypothetical protein ACU0DH_12275 [Paracoccus sp. (in: a-proteobacteria)]|uniref:hypothetical protein n=1 Tax=Paracoccus sp. TaxID=267 RepID=UPI004057CE2F